jgi:hypothetical protein
MNTESMTSLHQTAPWEWALQSAAATRLDASAEARWLLVTAGRAWLTRSGAGPEGADVWLAAGERHPLPAGSTWVVEGWPEARVAVLQAPQRRFSGPAWRRAFAPLRRAA